MTPAKVSTPNRRNCRRSQSALTLADVMDTVRAVDTLLSLRIDCVPAPHPAVGVP